MHVGHYVGSLANHVRLQHQYETFIIIAHVQALSTHFGEPALLSASVLDVAMDNLAAGVDPAVATLFVQSGVPEIAELAMFFSMLVSVNALRRNPTVKAEGKQYGRGELTYGFLGYPVSQAADIAFCRAKLVPVGADQVPHLELARKIIRRFNQLYGQVLVEPQPLVGEVPRLVGLDGSNRRSPTRRASG